MATNTFYDGIRSDEITFERPVGYLNVFVNAGVTFSFSVDDGVGFMFVPAGFHSFTVNPITRMQIRADGIWQIMAVQA
ncbi:MAG TPA: hypothetical protein ENH99_00375 [Candidatus Pacearchaeota archaeon]|uniref:Uncharacterized protein n=1 Tax=marine sediment metagenome TaxID=412755 RepID=A0A0F9C944_9ZZZZ|nr:hypothetical protein [Candidatus Pacearchaeota archaeon]